MSKQKPINVTISPESAQDVPTQDAHFQAVLNRIFPILEEEGYSHFMLTVYRDKLYSSALGGVKSHLEVAGLLLKAKQVCQEFIQYVKF